MTRSAAMKRVKAGKKNGYTIKFANATLEDLNKKTEEALEALEKGEIDIEDLAWESELAPKPSDKP